MTLDITEAKNPKFKDGTHVMFLSYKNEPNRGRTKGIVLYTRYNTKIERNQLFIKSYAYALPSNPENWSPMLQCQNIVRDESECIILPNLL